MADKDTTIRELVDALGLDARDWIVVDHWDSDPAAIGIAARAAPRRLVYVSSFEGESGRFGYQCEVPAGPEPTDYETVERNSDVPLAELIAVIEHHLRADIAMPIVADESLRLVSEELVSTHATRLAWSDAGRRRLYLLREDVDVPLSADPRVTIRAAVPGADSLRVIVTIGANDQGGASAAAFEEAFADLALATTDSLDRVSFLGFDVCDRDLYSAISNCGYDDNERADARRAWQAHLSEDHLVRELADARRFQRASNTRVAEHAPFFVFRLYRANLART